jgi:hypothetical protein
MAYTSRYHRKRQEIRLMHRFIPENYRGASSGQKPGEEKQIALGKGAKP